MFHHDPQHSGRVACSDITSTNVNSLKLAYPLLTLNGHIITVPAVVAGKIYVGTSLPNGAAGGGTMSGTAGPNSPLAISQGNATAGS